MSKAAHLPAAVADVLTGRRRRIPASSASAGQVMADESGAEELKLSHRLRTVEEGEVLYSPPLNPQRNFPLALAICVPMVIATYAVPTASTLGALGK